MTTTVEAALRLIDQTSQPMGRIKTNASQTERKIEDLGRTTESSTRKMESGMKRAEAATNQMADTGKRKIAELTAAIKELDKQRASAKIDVDTAMAEAKIRLLKHELRTLSTAEARRELTDLGLVTGSLTAAMGGGIGGGGGGSPGAMVAGAGGGGLRASIGGVTGSLGMMIPVVVAAAPAIVALTGAVSALVGSLGAAAGGAGALGVGALGAAVVGFGAIFAAAKPATTAIGEAKKAQEQYNEAVKQYGDASAQAVQAHKVWMSALEKAPPGTERLLENVTKIRDRWRELSRPAQGDFVGILNDGLRTANNLMDDFSGITNRVMRSTRRAMGEVFEQFRGPTFRRVIDSLGTTFERSIGPFTSALAGLGRFFGLVGEAASPLVVRMFESLDRWTNNLADSAENQNRVRRVITDMVDQLRSWVRFFGSAIKLAGAFFGAGAEQGQSMLERVTDQLDRWTEWLNEHPAEVQDFFRRTIDSAGKLAGAVGEIVSNVAKIADALLPVLNMMSDLVNTMGNAGLIGPAAALGAGALLMRGRGGLGALLGRGATTAGGGAAGAAAAGAAGAGAVASRGVLGTAWAWSKENRGLRRTALMGSTLAEREAARAGLAANRAAGMTAPGALARGGASALGKVGAAAGRVAPVLALSTLATGTGGEGAMGYARNATHNVTGLADFFTDDLLGLVNPFGGGFSLNHMSTGQLRGAQDKRDQGALNQLLSGMGDITSVAGAQRQIGQLRQVRDDPARRRNRTDQQIRNATDAINAEIQARKDLLPTLQAERAARSRDRGREQGASIQEGFLNIMRHDGPQAAMDFVSQQTRQHIQGKDFAGARQVAAAGLEAARMAAKENPKLQGEYEKLEKGVDRAFSRMGRNVVITHGRIIAAAERDWPRIRKLLEDPAEQARRTVSDKFTAIEKAAIGALTGMGYTPAQAKQMMRSGGSGPAGAAPNPIIAARQTPGSQSAAQAVTGAGANNPLMSTGPFASPTGDAWGNDAGRRGATPGGSRTRSAGGGGLMGADPGLGVYAQMAAGYGLHVSSGLRPGAVTSAGNQSYHASGHAIDVAGPPAAMMAFAKAVAAQAGPQLEELIYSPLGWSIKNGQRVAPYAVADHYDHVHLADTAPVAGQMGGGGYQDVAGAMGMANLLNLGRMATTGGMADAVAAAAVNGIAAGAENLVNSLALGGGGRGPAMPGGQGKGWLANLWTQAGGNPAMANVAAAVAMAESGGRTGAAVHSPNPGGGINRGPWQIWSGHPDSTDDPLGNAAAAVRISKNGTDWSAWEAYANGNYQQFMGDGSGRGGGYVATPAFRTGGRVGRAVVQSASAGRGGATSITVHIGTIENKREGDIAKMIHKEMALVAEALENGTLDGEDEFGL